MALVKELARDRIGTLPTGLYSWRLIFLERATLFREQGYNLSGDRVGLRHQVLKHE